MKTRIVFTSLLVKKSWSVICFAIALIFLQIVISCSPSHLNLEYNNVVKELREFEKANRDAVESKNIDEILTHYSMDLITITPEDSIIKGKEWIRQLLVDLYKDNEFHEDFQFIDIKLYGDNVVATLKYSQEIVPKNGDKPQKSTGHGMCVLRKSKEGNWQFEWNAYH